MGPARETPILSHYTMQGKFSLLNWSLLMLLVFLWGTSFMFVAISIRSVDPVTVVFGRIVIGALILVSMVYARGLRLPVALGDWAALCVLGLMGNVLPFMLITWGQLSVNSGIAGMIMATMPLITMILAHFFVEGENLNAWKVAGVTLGLGGITLLLGPVFEGGGQAVLGGIAIFFAASSYAVNTILIRRLPQFNPLVGSAGMLVAASVLLLPLWLMNADLSMANVSTGSLYAVIWLGIGPTAAASLVLFAVIERAGPTFLSTINYMIPVVAFFAGAWILSEPVALSSLLALVIILCGIAFTRIRA